MCLPDGATLQNLDPFKKSHILRMKNYNLETVLNLDLNKTNHGRSNAV